MVTAEDVLVGYITSDIIDDIHRKTEEPLIPAYLKTTSEGFLTAAYAYNGTTVRAFVCSPAGGVWQRVDAFTPSNPVIVNGEGDDTTFTFFGDDVGKAEAMEDEVFGKLDAIYEYDVTETSLFDAQLAIARDKCACSTTERVTVTIPLVAGTNVYPIVCKQCMRVHAVSESGKKTAVDDVCEVSVTGQQLATGEEFAAGVGVRWYEQYRINQDAVVSLADAKKWAVLDEKRIVGYILTQTQEDRVVILDLFVTEEKRGEGIMTKALRELAQQYADSPVFCDVPESCVNVIQGALDERQVVETTSLAGFELGQERLSSDGD